MVNTISNRFLRLGSRRPKGRHLIRTADHLVTSSPASHAHCLRITSGWPAPNIVIGRPAAFDPARNKGGETAGADRLDWGVPYAIYPTCSRLQIPELARSRQLL